MRDPTSMRFLHSVITLYQWPLPLPHTSYAHGINWIRSLLNIRDRPCSRILWLVLWIPEVYGGIWYHSPDWLLTRNSSTCRGERNVSDFQEP